MSSPGGAKKKTKKKKDFSEHHRQGSFFDKSNSLSHNMTTENDDSPAGKGNATPAIPINGFSQGSREREVEYLKEGAGTNIKIEIQDDQHRS